MKTVYLALMLHGNMCYDRYTKHTIREKFPRIYRTAVEALRRHPQVIAHIDLPGITIKSLQLAAPELLADLQELARRGQVVFVGCQYAASHAVCCDAETDVQAARVTMEIIRDELGFEPRGFFPQEIVRHPQTPWVMSQIGARWVIVPDRDWRRPRLLLALGGDQVVGIPLNHAHLALAALENSFDVSQDGDLLVMGGDFEMLEDLDALVAEVARLVQKGKRIEFTTFDHYLDQHPPTEEAPLHSCSGYQPEDWPDSPSFSRWTADPRDIEVHSHARQAMAAVRTAGMAAMVARLLWGAEADQPWKPGAVPVPENPWSADFEGVEDFPEVGARYLAHRGQRTLLSEAWHQLLVGVNSDARAWYPLAARRRHRTVCLDTAFHLAQTVTRNAMAALASRLAPAPALQDATRCLLLFNASPAKQRRITIPVAHPMAVLSADGQSVPCETHAENGALLADALVPQPPFGYTLLGLRPTDSSTTTTWEAGTRVENDGLAVSATEGSPVMTRDEQQVRLSLAPFRLTDPISGKSERVSGEIHRASVRVSRNGVCPRLEVHGELAWGLEARLLLEVWPEEVICDWEFRFDLPRQVGEGGWSPRGLLAVLNNTSGDTYYDVPCGVIRHANGEPSFFAASRFAAVCGKEGTAAIIPLGGEQSFFSHARVGELGLCLGASTEGEPRERPECTIDQRGYAHHHMPSMGNVFFGSVRHRFAILLGEGDWRAINLPAAASAHSQQPVIYETAPSQWRGDLPSSGVLLGLSPINVEIVAVRLSGERPQVLLSETHGQDTTATVIVAETTREVPLRPFQVANVEL